MFERLKKCVGSFFYKLFGGYIFARASKDSSKFRDYVRKLIKYEVDINIQDRYGNTPLMIACKFKDKKIVDELIKAGADINMDNRYGNTPLMIACMCKDTRIVYRLIKSGADMDAVNKNGDTALIIACANKLSRIAQQLIKKGAKVDVVNEMGCTPLLIACNFRDMKKVCHKLIARGSDVNVVNDWWNTPLIKACILGMSGIAHKLIARGADVHLRNKEGITPLLAACKIGSSKIIDELVLNGAYLRGEDLMDYLRTPYFNDKTKDISLVGKLIERGADCSKVFDEENKEYRGIFIEGINKDLNDRINNINTSIRQASETSVSKGHSVVRDLKRVDILLRKLERIKVSEDLEDKFNDMCYKNKVDLENEIDFFFNVQKGRAYRKNVTVLDKLECSKSANKGIHK